MTDRTAHRRTVLGQPIRQTREVATVPQAAERPSQQGERERRGELRFHVPGGAQAQYPAVFGADERHPGGGPFRWRTVRLAEGWEVRQRLLPREAATTETRDLLEQEVRGALTLVRAYRDNQHAGLFPMLDGYDLDADEPFALYPKQSFTPLAELAGSAGLEQQLGIARDLVLVVRLLEGVGLVHLGLSPDTIGWEDGRVRLLDLSALARPGWPRIPCGQPPWASHEQRTGTGEVDPRDTLWSVAQLMYFVLFGRPGDADGIAPELADDRTFFPVLGQAFAPLAERRPHAVSLLHLLACPDPLEADPPPRDPLDATRQEFDRQLMIKRRDLGLPSVAPAAAPKPVATTGRPPGAARPGPAGGRQRARWPFGGPRGREAP